MIAGFLVGLVFGAFFAVLIVRADLREKLFNLMNKSNKTVKSNGRKRLDD